MGKNNKNKGKKSKSTKVEDVVEQQVLEDHNEDDQNIDTQTKTALLEEDSDSVIEQTDKKSKKDFAEELDSLLDLRNEENELEKLVREENEKLRSLYSKLKKNKREQNSVINRLGSLHKSEVKSVSKEKRKRNKNVESGIQKTAPVPEALIKYLDLEDGAMLPRTKVVKMMHAKWKKEGLKNGQTTVLDKKHAKALGYSNGHVIEFKDYQPFISSFYNSEGSSKSGSKKSSKKSKAIDV